MQKSFSFFLLRLRLTLSAFMLLTFALTINAQELPAGFAPGEKEKMPAYLQSRISKGITTPPQGSIRSMAEWEEVQALVITWRSYPEVLREIVRHAQQECLVLITTTDSNNVISYLTSGNVPLTNVRFLHEPSNSVWMRDYAGNSVYRNYVDSLFLVDWIYNRPRPYDDVMPAAHASYFGLPLYETTQAPYDLVHTGGNYMSDGFGTAFSEMLVLDENPTKTEAEVDSLMKWFMGITRYIKVPNLQYDNIHHIDMHMKLLNEETLLVGEFPSGISDGPQIEANLLYILNNYNSVFGTPYRVVRIPMPPSPSGAYPGAPYGNAWYRTYTNSVIVNNTVIIPTYYEQYDTTALRIYSEAMPGYNIVGINCNQTISASGAIHCITHTIGVNDPLLISHQELPDSYSAWPYEVNARIQHKSGIQNATVYYRTDTAQPFQSVSMTLTNPAEHTWTGYIPGQTQTVDVHYYIEATAQSGKTQKRPMPAPDGVFKFSVEPLNVGFDTQGYYAGINDIFPNPASAITCVPLTIERSTTGVLSIYNVLGQQVHVIHQGEFERGNRNYFFDASSFAGGVYYVVLKTNNSSDTQKVIIR